LSKKLFVFDCDGVLTLEKSSWKALHEYFGNVKSDFKYFAELYRRGIISYIDWMKIDIALMIYSYGKPIKRNDVIKALSRVNMRPSAQVVISEIVEKGHIPAIVSSGVDILAESICKKLGVGICLYNELEFVNDELVPGGVARVPPKEKPAIVRTLAQETGIGLENTVYIGDDEWDINVFKIVPISIAVEPCGSACQYATFVVRDLIDILELGVIS